MKLISTAGIIDLILQPHTIKRHQQHPTTDSQKALELHGLARKWWGKRNRWEYLVEIGDPNDECGELEDDQTFYEGRLAKALGPDDPRVKA